MRAGVTDMSCVGVCILEGSSDVRGTLTFEAKVCSVMVEGVGRVCRRLDYQVAHLVFLALT